MATLSFVRCLVQFGRVSYGFRTFLFRVKLEGMRRSLGGGSCASLVGNNVHKDLSLLHSLQGFLFPASSMLLVSNGERRKVAALHFGHRNLR